MLAAEYALHLFHWTWQGSVVAFIALAIVRSAPRASARFRSAVLLVAIVKCLLPPMLAAKTGLFSRLPLTGASLLGGNVLPLLGGALAAIHLVGAVLKLATFVRRHRTLRRDLTGGWSIGRVRVVVMPSGDPMPPLAFGWLHPVIALPQQVVSLGRRERRIVFAHERSHIDRGHGLAVIVEELIAALAWIQPMLRLVIDERRRIREELCDHDALVRLKMAPADYAAGLLAVASRCAATTDAAGAVAATAPATTLRARFRALARRSRWSAAEVVAALLISITLLPGIRPLRSQHGAPGSHHIHSTR